MFWWNYKTSNYRISWEGHAVDESQRWTLHDHFSLWNSLWKLFNFFNEKTASVLTRSSIITINHSLIGRKERESWVKMRRIKEKTSFTWKTNKRSKRYISKEKSRWTWFLKISSQSSSKFSKICQLSKQMRSLMICSQILNSNFL